MRFTHYGSKEYLPEMFCPVRNIPQFNKPIGGLWASPVGAEYGWAEWCQDEEFREANLKDSFEFKLAETARIFCIDTVADVEKMPTQEPPQIPEELKRLLLTKEPSELLPIKAVDFEAMAQEYDAILFNMSNAIGLYNALYGWDCDSLLVLNSDVIEIV